MRFMKNLLSAALIASAAWCFGVEGTSKGANVNIRFQPNTGSAAVGKLARGEKIEVVAADGQWVKIQLKSGAETYVSAQLVNADGKTASRIQLRSGAGTDFASYGVIPAGTPVKVVETTDNGWVKIEPPAGICGYVAASLVAFDAAGVPKLDGAAAGTAGTADPAPAVKIPAKPFDDLTVVEGSGKAVVITGLLAPVESEAKNVRFALAVVKNNKYVVDAYVHTGGSRKLDAFANKTVKITGVAYKVNKWSKPVLLVQKVAPAE